MTSILHKILIYFIFVCRSTCLLIQAALPCLFFSNGKSELHLKGGTNAEMAPQIDYLTWVGITGYGGSLRFYMFVVSWEHSYAGPYIWLSLLLENV